MNINTKTFVEEILKYCHPRIGDDDLLVTVYTPSIDTHNLYIGFESMINVLSKYDLHANPRVLTHIKQNKNKLSHPAHIVEWIAHIFVSAKNFELYKNYQRSHTSWDDIKQSRNYCLLIKALVRSLLEAAQQNTKRVETFFEITFDHCMEVVFTKATSHTAKMPRMTSLLSKSINAAVQNIPRSNGIILN